MCSLRASHTSLPCPYHTSYLRVRLCDSHLTPPGCKLHAVGTRSVTFPDNLQCLAHHRASAFSNKRKKKKIHSSPHRQRDLSNHLPRLPWASRGSPVPSRQNPKALTGFFQALLGGSCPAPTLVPSSSALVLPLYTLATTSFFRYLENPVFSLTPPDVPRCYISAWKCCLEKSSLLSRRHLKFASSGKPSTLIPTRPG